jgi:murein L,D-transpeptidase YcbB/YkuD
MPRSRLLALAFSICLAGNAVTASGQVAAPEAQTAQPAGLVPPPPLPQQPLAAELAPPTGFATEFAQRLSTEGRLRSAEKADRVALKQFYEERGNEPVWTTSKGLTLAAKAAIEEIGRADDWGLDAAAFRLPALIQDAEPTREQRADAEIAVSLAVLQYARHARGGRADPLSLSRNLDRKPQLLDPRSVIEAAASTDSPAAYLRALHPQHPQFERLRQAYLSLKRGDPAPVEQVVEQKGKGKSKKKHAAKAPAGPSVRTLLVNMEQWRWMPEDLGSFYVWVNIPEYTVRVVRSGHVIHSERVIVGRAKTPTPVFSHEMQQVIFHPYWGVPESIKTKELLPSLAKGNIGVLERQNLRVSYRGRDINPATVDWTKADMRKFHVYQPPGNSNALGIVKFRFPNKHDVYMHDTPSRSLFNANARAFSHGCMRVRDPLKLAELVLAEDRGWTASRVTAAVRNGPKDNQINLINKVPVHMTYFTAWVDDDGKVKTFADIYGHESRIALGISGKSYMIQRDREDAAPTVQVKRPTPARTAATSARGGDRDWMRRVFQY